MGRKLARAETILTVKWVVPIIRILLAGPSRFSRIRASLPGVSANILADRLRLLEAAGVLERATMPDPASVQVYGLTSFGHDARCIVEEMDRWSESREQTTPNASQDGKIAL